MSGWTEQDDADLRRAIDDGLSGSQAGARLGRSRAACIGRAFRMGLSFGKGSAVRAKLQPRPRKPSKPPVPVSEPIVEAVPVAIVEPVEQVLDTREYGSVRFLDVRSDQCRWFPGDHSAESFVCGEPVKNPGGAYCAKHHARVYVPMSARNDKLKGKAHARAGY